MNIIDLISVVSQLNTKWCLKYLWLLKKYFSLTCSPYPFLPSPFPSYPTYLDLLLFHTNPLLYVIFL